MSIPLVQNNEKDSINTSIIAIKKNLERINSILGLVDSGSDIDTSEFVKKSDIVDVVQSGNMNPVTSNAVATSNAMPVDTVTSGNMHSVTSNAVYNNFLNKYRQVKLITAPNGSAIIQASGNNSAFCCYLITITRDSEQDTAIGIIYWIYGSGFFIKWIIPPTTTRFNVTIVQDSLSKATINFTNNYEMRLSILDLNGRGTLTLS